MKRCKNCGAQIADDARFCIHCMTALNEKTELKPIKIIGRWRRYSAIALLLCLALILTVFALSFQGTDEEPQDTPPDLSELVSADSDGLTDSQDTPTDPTSSETSETSETDDSETASDFITDTNLTSDTGAQPTDQTDATSSQESNKSTSDTIETESSDSLSDSADQTDSDSSDKTTDNTQTAVPNPLFASGSGTAEDPYIIRTTAQLNNVRSYRSSHFKLGNDIVFSAADFEEGGTFYNGGAGWEPISPTREEPFSGTFDGNGYKVKNLSLRIEFDAKCYVGLFGVLSGTVKNLGLQQANIEATKIVTDQFINGYTGGICGRAETGSTISDCSFSGTLTGSGYTGGIAGFSGGTVTKCHNGGTVSGSNRETGGIVGWLHNSGCVSICKNTGSVVQKNSSYAGAIVGGINMPCTINDCYNAGSVTSDSHAGGIVGFMPQGTLKNCYNVGTVTASTSAGGIIGSFVAGIDLNPTLATIENCYYPNSFSTGIGSGSKGEKFCTKYTDEQMKQQASYAGFDFDSVWIMGSSSYPYPILRALQKAQ